MGLLVWMRALFRGRLQGGVSIVTLELEGEGYESVIVHVVTSINSLLSTLEW